MVGTGLGKRWRIGVPECLLCVSRSSDESQKLREKRAGVHFSFWGDMRHGMGWAVRATAFGAWRQDAHRSYHIHLSTLS